MATCLCCAHRRRTCAPTWRTISMVSSTPRRWRRLQPSRHLPRCPQDVEGGRLLLPGVFKAHSTACTIGSGLRTGRMSHRLHQVSKRKYSRCYAGVIGVELPCTLIWSTMSMGCLLILSTVIIGLLNLPHELSLGIVMELLSLLVAFDM